MGYTGQRGHTSENSPGGGRRVPGLYIGRVIERVDPRRLSRVLIRVPEVGGQQALAWARVLAPFGGALTGAPLVPPVGAGVVVAFEADDPNRPVVLGGLWFQSGEESQVPLAARGVNDPVRAFRGKDQTTTADGEVIQEPPDPFGATYPNNVALRTPGADGAGGHLLEADDTPGVERISLTHFPSGSWLEFHPDGSLVLGVQKDRYAVVVEKDTLHVKGDQSIEVEGVVRYRAGGEWAQETAGYRLRTTAGWEVKATGAAELTAKSLDVKTASTVAIEASGEASVKGSLVRLGPEVGQAPVVTTRTHPIDYISGIPIVGDPSVLAG